MTDYILHLTVPGFVDIHEQHPSVVSALAAVVAYESEYNVLASRTWRVDLHMPAVVYGKGCFAGQGLGQWSVNRTDGRFAPVTGIA